MYLKICSDSRIEAQMKVLNDDYKAAGITWVLSNVTRVQNSQWYNGSFPGSYVHLLPQA